MSDPRTRRLERDARRGDPGAVRDWARQRIRAAEECTDPHCSGGVKHAPACRIVSQGRAWCSCANDRCPTCAGLPFSGRVAFAAACGADFAAQALNWDPYYVVVNSGNAVLVKQAAFFEDQGGLTEKWGRAWIKVWAPGRTAYSTARGRAKPSTWLLQLLGGWGRVPMFRALAAAFNAAHVVAQAATPSPQDNDAPPVRTELEFALRRGVAEVRRWIQGSNGPLPPWTNNMLVLLRDHADLIDSYQRSMGHEHAIRAAVAHDVGQWLLWGPDESKWQEGPEWATRS